MGCSLWLVRTEELEVMTGLTEIAPRALSCFKGVAATMCANFETVAFSVPRETSQLSTLRQVTLSLAARVGFAASDCGKIEMAIDEACANIMAHQERGSTLDFECTIRGGELCVILCDGGKPYAFCEGGKVDLDAWNRSAKPGGLGLYIIKTFMDEVSYEHRDGRNVLSMRKFVTGLQASL
jgi:serine/threonine-protein kinase RsbW